MMPVQRKEQQHGQIPELRDDIRLIKSGLEDRNNVEMMKKISISRVERHFQNLSRHVFYMIKMADLSTFLRIIPLSDKVE